MEIIIDSREKAKAIQKIIAEFDRQGVRYAVSKLFVGDYQSLDDARLVIDRKQSLTELCGNVCQQHARFKAELVRAQEMGIKLIILVEHGGKITSLEAVKEWVNPRRYQWEKKIREHWNIPLIADFETELAELKRHGAKIQPPPTSGEQLFKMLSTISEKYNVEFQFCQKSETGKRIIELLGGG
jgi:predicted SnoaL-like aldol condensation-catalyzing enzyme